VNRSLASIVLVLVAGAAPGAHAAAPSAQPAAPSAGQTLDVLVLGDSYSAGNGATGTTYGPAGCYRNTTHWGERYAAGLRETGRAVSLTNHACSGGRTPDVHTPRPMDTQSGRTTPAPPGVTTTSEADAHLREADPCNTRAFPDEEFWTYRATAVSGGTITYDCTRTLRPQADFVTADTDLVVLTMGGNDAGFSTIVQGCFVLGTRSASACRSAVDDARALVPAIKQHLLDDVAALRAHGLREDARIVQLGYPWLQLDNGFTLPDPDAPLTPYPAGDAVRSLISDATAELATLPALANVGHPGQMTFVDGVTTAFSGHEPDAQSTNPQTWINQAFSGPDTNVWYHPNDLGQAAYARLLLAHGTFGAGAPTTTPPPGAGTRPTATLRVRPTRHRFGGPGPVVLRVRARLSDDTVPSGRLVVRLAGHREPVTSRVVRTSADGRLRLRVRGLRVGRHRLVVLYRDRLAAPVTDRVRVRVVPRSR
jgi:lysophospholipase L1-like esterase